MNNEFKHEYTAVVEQAKPAKQSVQSIYFSVTIPVQYWQVPSNLPEGMVWLRGQREVAEGGLDHWQLACGMSRSMRILRVKNLFCKEAHIECSRSKALDEYVWKEDTRVKGTQFELGEKALKRNSKEDWSVILNDAKQGTLDNIPADILIRCYSSITRISVDFATPCMRGPQEVIVLWGPTGTGKSRWAFDNAGGNYYLKAPLSKWWDSYRGEETIILDEFRGVIDISHMLRWLDRYPCSAEKKGSQTYLKTKKWIITSNLKPEEWYPSIDPETFAALRRRFTKVIHLSEPYGGIMNKGKGPAEICIGAENKARAEQWIDGLE